MKENLTTAITKAANETEKAKALMAVLENRVMFESEAEDPDLKEKIAKALYALWDSIEEIGRNLDDAAEVLAKRDVLCN